MTTAKARHALAVRLAAGIAGYCAFINLYSPQAILPLLSQEFGASAAAVSTIITVSTLAVALTAPFTGTIADVLGRKRVIVVAMFALVIPTIMVGLSTSLSAMIFWRAVQGLVLPPIFAVMVAYIGDELPQHEATTVAGIYSSGSSLGGFSGRLFVGLLADLVTWRAGFMALATIAFIGALIVAFLLPHERKFVRSEGLVSAGKQMLAHLRNKQLIATYAVGGAMAGFAALLMTARMNSAHPTAGIGLEFDAIAAVAVGGTSFERGNGWLTGTLLGVLVVGVLRNGLNLMAVPSSAQVAGIGALVIAALLIDGLRSRP